MMKNILLILITLISLTIKSQTVNEIQKIQPSELNEEDRFGYTVAVSDEYAIIGSPGDDENGTDAGVAYVFYNNNGTWEQSQKLISNDIQAGDFFGYAAAISGDYAIISTPVINNYAGAVYVFYNNAGTWSQVAKLTASDASDNDYFGFQIDISGNYAIIGAYGDDDGGNESGSAYIFYNNAGTWSEQAKLTASDADVNYHFGKNVSIYGDYAVVGATLSKNADVVTGSAYIFKNNSGVWSEVQKITSSDASVGDHFGSSVSINNNVIVVGANYKSNNGTWSGAAYVFNKNVDNWEQEVKLLPSDASEFKHFGNAVDISDNAVIIGAKGNQDSGTYVQGAAYVYHNTTGTYLEVAKLSSSDNMIDDAFAYALAISDKHIIVGAQMNDAGGLNAGSAYSFDVFPTKIITQPIPQLVVSEGTNVVFSILAQGTEISYQWRKNEIDLIDDGNISGVNTAQLSISSATTADMGAYDCVVTGTYGTVTSSDGILTIPIDISKISKNNISIYPNPTSGIFTINLEASLRPSSVSNIEITDITGKTISSRDVACNVFTMQINLKNQPAGIYFIKIQTENKIIIKKIVKK